MPGPEAKYCAPQHSITPVTAAGHRAAHEKTAPVSHEGRIKTPENIPPANQNVCRTPIRTSVCVLLADEMPLPTSPTEAVALTTLPYGSSVLPLAF